MISPNVPQHAARLNRLTPERNSHVSVADSGTTKQGSIWPANIASSAQTLSRSGIDAERLSQWLHPILAGEGIILGKAS